MTTTSLPENGWLPDPRRAGTLRYRERGHWTDCVIIRQAPWGPGRVLPPVTRERPAVA